ncbi:hypothetical protein ACF0H5_012685 [Mactra antiquata]
MSSLHFIIIYICITVAWTVQIAPQFTNGTSVGKIDNAELNEVSGCAASRMFKDVLYMHNDHGDRPRIFAVNATNAMVIATFEISPAEHYDWEDIAVGPCSKTDTASCIFILDDGTYHGVDKRTIYRLYEPSSLVSQTIAPNGVLKYNWTERAADTIMVDPDANVYIIGNVLGGRGMMIQLPDFAWNNNNPVWVESGSFFSMYSTHTDPESGDISSAGNEVLVKNSGHVYYWKYTDGDVVGALIHPGADVPYIAGGLAETVCWSADAQAYFTISEGLHASLNTYTRV